MNIAFIGTSAPIDSIWKKLAGKLEPLKSNGLKFKIEQVPLRDYAMLRFSLDDMIADTNTSMARQYIASALADIMVEQLEPKIVWRIIQQDYQHYSSSDQAKVFILAEKRLAIGELYGAAMNNNKIMRRNRILYCLLEYFAENDTIILEGFINFRLRGYLKDLRHVVDEAVNELLVRREKEEFTRLLQYYIDMQRPKTSCVHVVFQEDNGYKLFDHNKQIIKHYYNRLMGKELQNRMVDDGDILISILIKLAPSKIIIHKLNTVAHADLIITLQGIFKNKISLCPACDFCKKF